MDEILKGNFKVKRPVKLEKEKVKDKENRLKKELREKALASLGGSMVYMERDLAFTWEGDE